MAVSFGTRQKVFVVHVRPDNVFFIQLDTEEAYALPDLSRSIREEVESGQQQVIQPKEGLRCCALSDRDGVWYRAIITKCSGPSVMVYYVDYGNTEELPVNNLAVCSESYFTTPYQAIQCVLSDFTVTSSIAKVNETLTSLILDQEFHAVVQSRCSDQSQQGAPFSIPCYNVTLFANESSSVSVSEELVKGGLGHCHICNNRVEIGTKYLAFSSFDDSPGKFWVQFSSQAVQLQELMDDLNNPETISSLSVLPASGLSPGVGCCALYEEELYYRAEIVAYSHPDKRAMICYVDYGNCSNVAITEIKQLPSRLTIHPFFATQCCLEGIKPIKPPKPDPKLGNIAWNKLACQKFNELIQDVELEVHIVSEISPDIFSAHIKDVSKAEDLGQAMCNFKFAEIAVPNKMAALSTQAESISQAVVSDYKYLELEVNKKLKNLFISYAESPAVVWCQPAEQPEKFEAMMEDLARVGPTLPFLTNVKEDLPCCVSYALDGSWCRGCVQSVDKSSSSAQVLFVDYGNIETLKQEDIKTLPVSFLDLPAQAVSFSMADISPRRSEDWNEEAIKCFQEIVTERRLNCEVVGLDADGFPAAKLYDPMNNNINLAMELVHRGHAKSPLTSSGTSQQQKLADSSFSSSPQRSKGHGSPQATGFSRSAGPVPPSPSQHSTRSTSSSSSSPGRSAMPPKHSKLKLTVGTQIKATVSHVESLNEFYIQLASSTFDLDQLGARIEAHCRSSAARAIRSPSLGWPVLAKFSGDGNWYRGLVSQSSKNAYEVMFVDFGNTERMAASDLVQMPPKLLDLPIQAIPCSLNGVHASKKIPEKIIDAFGNMTIEQTFEVFVDSYLDNKKYVVDLFTSNRDSILQQLVNKCSIPESVLKFSSSSPSPARPQVIESPEVALPKLPVGQPVDVMISYVESPASFFVQLTDSYLDLEKMLDGLNEYYSQLSGNQESLTEVSVGQFCAAKFSEDNLWYRARVIKLAGSQAHVLYIDYGNSEMQQVSALKALKVRFSKTPCIGILCSLAGSRRDEPYSAQTCDEFSKFRDRKLVGVFKTSFKNHEDAVSVALTDTAKPGVEVDVYTAICGTKKVLHQLISRVTPVLECPMESAVSFVVSPDEVYCQLMSERSVFDNLMDRMYAFYEENKGGSPLSSPTSGLYCAALCSDGSWYRAMITAVSPNGITVHYLDYGNKEEVHLSFIRSLEPEFSDLPIQAIKCYLCNIESNWSSDCLKKVPEQLLEKAVSMICLEHSEKQGYGVQLIVDGEDYVDVLQREGLARKVSKGPLKNRTSATFNAAQDSLKIDQFPTEKDSTYHVVVTYAESPLEFYAQVIDTEEKLDGLMQEIAAFCAASTPPKVNWKPGDYLVAQFTEDDAWYRGLIKSTVKSGFDVFYLDYGNAEILQKDRFRKLRRAFCNLPAQAIKCRLEGAQYYKYTDKSIQKFNDLLLNQEFMMNCISISEEGVCAVNLQLLTNDVDVMSLAIEKNIVEAKVSTSSSSLSEPSKLNTHTFPDGVSTDSFHDVCVVHAESPDLFFCQFSLESISALEKLMKEMEQYYSLDPTRAKPPESCQIGRFVAAQFSADQSWYRAVISDIKGDNVHVIFVDYGNSEMVPLSGLKKLEPQFANLPAQAIPCSLAEVVPTEKNGWSEATTVAFSELVVEHSFVAEIKSSVDLSGKLFKFGDGQHLKVSLIDAETSKIVAEELIQQELAVPEPEVEQDLVVPGLTSEHYITPNIQPESTYAVYVSYIESPSCFWLQMSSNQDFLLSIENLMVQAYSKDYTKFPQLVDPLPGTICCARFSQDGQWYRGVVKNKHPQGLDILFVDYGNSEIVSPAEVRTVMSDLMTWETQAFQCSLHNCRSVGGDNDWDENAVGIFNELVMDKALCAQIVDSCSGNSWSVRLLDGDSDVCDQLVQCGVAIKDVTSDSGGKLTTPIISQVQLSMGQSYPVYIAYVDSPTRFFCQLVSDFDKLESLMAEIADFYNENNLEPLLEEGAYCVAQYSSNYAWYRAQILSILPEGILVNFIDYGNSEIVAADQILALGSQFASLPSQAIVCSMVEDVDYQFSSEELNRFVAYDLDQNFTIIATSVTPTGFNVVRLFDRKDSLVNEAIKCGLVMDTGPVDELIVPSSVDVQTKPEITSYQPLQYVAGNKLEVSVSHVMSPTSFFCQPLEFSADLDDMMTDIGSYMANEHYQPLEKENIRSGKVCLAQYTEDDEWYRAIIEEVISESHVLVNFIDYGNREIISPDRISILPARFAKLPLQAFHCSVFDSNRVAMTWTMDQVEQFKKLAPENSQLTVEIKCFLPDSKKFYVVASRNEQPLDISVLLDQKLEIDLNSANKLEDTLEELPANISTTAVKDSKTSTSRESISDNADTESDDGLEGKPLIQAPFKLILAVQEVLEVFVVFVESPSLVYLQRADCNAELDALSDEIVQYCVTFEENQRFLQTFHEGDFVLAKWSQDNVWYRGEVVGVDTNGGAAKVHFIDYGNVEVIMSDKLVMCPGNFLELPAQAIPCSLAQVPHRESWPMAYKEMITELVKEKVMRASVVLPASQGMKPTVKLEDVDSGVDVAEVVLRKLQDECEGGSNGVIAEEEEDEEREGAEQESVALQDAVLNEEQKPVLPKKSSFEIGSSHSVFVVSCASPHSFMCHLCSEAEVLSKITRSLSDIYDDKDQEMSTPVPSSLTDGSYVAAQFSEDEQWYRAEIISCNKEDTYECLYVDFGNTELVPLQRIRSLDGSLTAHAPLAFECFLYGIEAPSGNLQFPPEAADKILELIGEEKCVMNVHNVDSGGHYGVGLLTSAQEDIGTTLISACLASPMTPPMNKEADEVVGRESSQEITASEEEEEPILTSHTIPSQNLEEAVQYRNQAQSPKLISIPGQTNELGDDQCSTTASINDQHTTADDQSQPTDDKSATATANESAATGDQCVTTPTSENQQVTSEDQLVTTPTSEDQPVTTPTSEDQPVTTPTSEDQPVTTPTSEDQPVTTPTSEDQPVTTPTSEDQPVTTPTSEDQTPTTEDQPVTTSTTEDKSVNISTTDQSVEDQSMTIPTLEDQSVTTPTTAETVVAAAKDSATVSRYQSIDLTVGSHHTVVMSVVSTLDEFWCQLTSHKAQLKEMMDIMVSRDYKVGVSDDELSCAHPEPSLPVCACSSEGSGMWRRAEVVSTKQAPNTCKVLYVDHGSTETLSLERIKLLEECFGSLPPQAVRCSLPVLLENDLAPNFPSSMDPWELEWPTSCLQHFTELTCKGDGELCLEVVEARSDGSYVVRLLRDALDIRESLVAKLRDPNLCSIKPEEEMPTPFDDVSGEGHVTPKTEANELGFEDTSTPGDTSTPEDRKEPWILNGANADQDDTSNEPKQCQDNADIEHDELGTLPDGNSADLSSVGSTLNLIYTSGSSPNSFTCQYFDDVYELYSLMGEIKDHVISLEDAEPPGNLKRGDLVIAKYSVDNTWYRGEVYSDSPSGGCVDILFVDYGYIDSVSLDDIQSIPPELTKLRKQAVACCLGSAAGVMCDKWSEEAFVKFKGLAESCECLIATVVGHRTDHVVVSLKSDTCSDFAEHIQ